VHAHSTGKNLQRYNKNLLLIPSSSGDAFEQLLGRTHRPGQTADDVSCEMFMHTAELYNGFQKSLQDALYIQESTGLEQKLNMATIKISNKEEIEIKKSDEKSWLYV